MEFVARKERSEFREHKSRSQTVYPGCALKIDLRCGNYVTLRPHFPEYAALLPGYEWLQMAVCPHSVAIEAAVFVDVPFF
jgi:hypothetical protein